MAAKMGPRLEGLAARLWSLSFAAATATAAGCASGSDDGLLQAAPPGADDAGAGSSSGGGVRPDAGGGGGAFDDASAAGDAASTRDDGGTAGDDGSSPASDGAAPQPAPCPTGGVTADQVVMLGDSYFDPLFSNAALDLFTDAQNAGALPASTTYRHYYQGGASMNSGSLQFNIPYQYENEALTDIAVPTPKDIKVVIMDGGGNDVLINDRTCLTSPPPGNTGCASTIQGAVARAQALMKEAVGNGVQQIVFLFYPHLDTAGGGILPTPAPGVNDTLDYAYPLAETACCGAPFVSSLQTYSCTGVVSGAQCTFIDTRPAFEGHTADYIKNDMVHPTPAGAQVIADLIWEAMKANCVAQ